jgi:prolyl oligopeptidase
LADAHSKVLIHALDGRFEREVALPGLGTAGGFGGEIDEMETFYSFASFTSPPTIFRYDFTTGESSLFRRSPTNFDASAYTTEQVFYTSKDGTRVPMFLTYKKGLKLEGKNPTLLYGYGGFNMQSDAGVRGRESRVDGAGRRLRDRQPARRRGVRRGLARGRHQDQEAERFRRLHRAAEWLIANGYTNPKKLAIQGGSNGGLLVGACLTQRPELFGAALPAVGVMDMLRFQKFTIGWAGPATTGPQRTRTSLPRSINTRRCTTLKPGTKLSRRRWSLPPTTTTAWCPAHSFKFAAALQAAQAGPAPT